VVVAVPSRISNWISTMAKNPITPAVLNHAPVSKAMR
jgi:hypothetical protein